MRRWLTSRWTLGREEPFSQHAGDPYCRFARQTEGSQADGSILDRATSRTSISACQPGLDRSA
jgi:hypothetical protein